MAFSFSFQKAGDFKRCVEALAVLVDEAEFVADDAGLTLKATDPSQISMVDFVLQKDAFAAYEVSGTTKIGVDLDYLNQVMGRASAQDALDVELEETESKLKIVFKGNARRAFRIPLIDVSQQNIPTPKITFDTDLKIRAGALQEGLKDASLVSTHIVLGTEGESFFMNATSSKGTFRHEARQKEDEALLEIKSASDTRAMFPLDYLKDMLKSAPGDAEVTLGLKADHPVKIAYPVGGAHITYYLAPRIEE